jgi:hypothetical protein
MGLVGDISTCPMVQIPVALPRRVYPLIVLDSLNSLNESQRARYRFSIKSSFKKNFQL